MEDLDHTFFVLLFTTEGVFCGFLFHQRQTIEYPFMRWNAHRSIDPRSFDPTMTQNIRQMG